MTRGIFFYRGQNVSRRVALLGVRESKYYDRGSRNILTGK